MRRLRLALGSIGGPEESRSAIKIGIIGFQFGLPLIGTDHAIPSCVTFFNHHFQVKPNYKTFESDAPHVVATVFRHQTVKTSNLSNRLFWACYEPVLG